MSEHIQLSVALCRIGFYTCLQKLCCKAPPPPRPEYDVVCIGLSGAGKTSLLSRLCNEISDGTVPTTGAETIKKYWSRYYQGSQGVVFVLNSAASDEEMEASRSELHLALQHPQLCTLPFLVLANHQDSPAARSVSEGNYTRVQKKTGCNSKHAMLCGRKPNKSHTTFNANRRRLWLTAIKRAEWSEDLIKNAGLCSSHAISDTKVL
ncbi:ADP-ribosylation factor-like protein 15a isoform X3 [Danio rerio]|uniref:ADP-ribosylation factor-like protein 15a isoform X3 n=1 Tax=Danio rerio TaxID=7955 RepID=A0AC58JKA9_DANRE